MYYVVKFLETNTIGVVRKDWMINENTAKYPPKNARKRLKDEKTRDTSSWKIYECVLKYPSKYGENGFINLKDAIEKENFYTNYTDSEDYEKYQQMKIFDKKHPTAKFADQLNLNDMVLTNRKVHLLFAPFKLN